jgi:hypothetical protein
MSASVGRLRNAVAYFVSPQILSGILANAATEGIDTYKICRAGTQAINGWIQSAVSQRQLIPIVSIALVAMSGSLDRTTGV